MIAYNRGITLKVGLSLVLVALAALCAVSAADEIGTACDWPNNDNQSFLNKSNNVAPESYNKILDADRSLAAYYAEGAKILFPSYGSS